MSDDDFGEEAHEWILILRDYQKIISFASKDNTRHKAQARWEVYQQQFPKSFIKLFDPKDLQGHFGDSVSSLNLQTLPITTVPSASLSPTVSRVKQLAVRRNIRVTRSGKLHCNHCGRWNQVYAGLLNPICGNCRNPLL